MLILLLAAIAPAIILLWYVYKKDTHPEPTGLIVKAFCFGGISALLSTFISGPLLNMGFYTSEATTVGEAIRISFFGAAIPEESAKLFMLWLLLRRCKDFDERYDGIVYSSAVGLGFAAFENLLYVVGAGASWVNVAFSRAIFAVPGHWAFAVAMGYYYSLNHFQGKSAPSGPKLSVWLVPERLHGICDTLCFVSELNVFFSVVISIVLLVFCFKMFKSTRNRVLTESSNNVYYGAGNSVRYNGYDITGDWTGTPEDQ